MRIRKPFPGISVLKATLPYAMIVLLMSAHYRLDGFLLERLHPNGDYQAGIYAGAYRLLDASNMIGFLLASFLLPYTANLLSKRKSIEPVVLSSRHLLIIFSLFISITVIFQAGWLDRILYTTNDPSAVAVMQLCLPVLIVYSLVHVYGTVLTARGHLLPLCYILLVSVAANIVMNLLLIPGYGARGCCISALISQGFCGIASMIYAKKKSGIKLDIRTLLIYIFIGVLLAALYYLCRNIPVSPWLLISLAGLFTAALAFQFKLVDFKRWQANIIHEPEK
jgi:O-antigen/teichoic acid export membrane protein